MMLLLLLISAALSVPVSFSDGPISEDIMNLMGVKNRHQNWISNVNVSLPEGQNLSEREIDDLNSSTNSNMNLEINHSSFLGNKTEDLIKRSLITSIPGDFSSLRGITLTQVQNLK